MSLFSLPELQNEIGSRLTRGDLTGAEALAARCRADWPADRSGWLLGSIVALLEDKKDAALVLIEERLQTHPADVQCLLQKAECLLALGNRNEALAASEAASEYAQDGLALDAIGEFLVHAGEHHRALGLYDRAVAAAPKDPTIRAKRAVICRFLGQFDRAASDYEAVLQMLPMSPKALKGLVELRNQSHGRNSIASLEAALAKAPTGSSDAAMLHFGLAKSCEDLGEYARSWRHLSAGNAIERSLIRYSSATDRLLIEELLAGFPATEPPWADTTGERPIFIVGMPRTGTTLVDRIIGTHSQVHSAGELAALSESVDAAVERSHGVRLTDCHRFAAALGALEGRIIAEEYLARARVWRGRRLRFTDKQLMNFYYCPLILRAFPKARIVHITRHPLATCHAVYRNRFNGSYPFAYALDEIAEFYIGYRRLMAHWHAVLPERILDIAYEDVVTALEPTTRRVLEYLDLPFEGECLEFYRNPAPVETASSVQVRQPLYDSSLQLWRHYAEELAPVRARLEAAGIAVD